MIKMTYFRNSHGHESWYRYKEDGSFTVHLSCDELENIPQDESEQQDWNSCSGCGHELKYCPNCGEAL